MSLSAALTELQRHETVLRRTALEYFSVEVIGFLEPIRAGFSHFIVGPVWARTL